ncbi:hypothetical protein GCM10010271_73170 [Streptomyces kurssanovii]|nr:hypothetical protein GCM10010271_73170 [Streptomyces kurssanovii]
MLGAAATAAGATLRFSATVTELHDDGEGVDVTLSDGSAGRWDLVVGFDGIGSPLRTRLYGERYAPQYTGFANWRVTVPRQTQVDGVVMSTAGQDGKALLTPITDELMYLGPCSPRRRTSVPIRNGPTSSWPSGWRSSPAPWRRRSPRSTVRRTSSIRGSPR